MTPNVEVYDHEGKYLQVDTVEQVPGNALIVTLAKESE